jgi:hypothetical protein
MRWRLVDSIEDVEAWTSIHGRKTVSLEEYSLLEPLGRKGCFPESLVLESCVHLVRWLAVVSSDFRQSCVLLEVGRFSVEHETKPGAVLTVSAKVLDKQEDKLTVECEVVIGGQRYGHGTIMLFLVPLGEIAVAEDMRTLWQELYAKA